MRGALDLELRVAVLDYLAEIEKPVPNADRLFRARAKMKRLVTNVLPQQTGASFDPRAPVGFGTAGLTAGEQYGSD